MPRISFVHNLDRATITQLHEKIRENRYGDHTAVVEWLNNLGVKVSRSALHRYATELKHIDGYSGTSGSFKLHSALNNFPTRNDNLIALYKELGEVEYKRQFILDRIREIMGSPKITDSN